MTHSQKINLQAMKEAYYKNKWLAKTFKFYWVYQAVMVSVDCLRNLLKICGLYQVGYKNALALTVRHQELTLPRLPEAFEGIKILFLSDLHIGPMTEMPETLVEKIRDIKPDLCLLGGDYRFSNLNPHIPYLDGLKKIAVALQAPLGVYGVLGNHDELEMVSHLEAMGIKILINDSVPIEKKGQTIRLVGVDNPMAETRRDMKKAFASCPENDFKICLAHSPDLYHEAEERGSDLYLCGHTHHGQIRFPVVGSIMNATTAPGSFTKDHWRYKKMQGYTSAGVGTVAICVRFLCPPEVTVLTLRKNTRPFHNESLANPK